jgi:hypothetical protein
LTKNIFNPIISLNQNYLDNIIAITSEDISRKIPIPSCKRSRGTYLKAG